MELKILSIEEFTNFQQNHQLSNFYQTINYAMLMAENNYDYDLIGLVDEYQNVLAASLILIKPIGIKCFYGYAPRGFLIDYDNYDLVRIFTDKLKKYYYQKNVIFIKINPNLAIGKVIDNDYNFKYNEYSNVKSLLVNLGYKKLRDNLYFEAKLPRFNAIIDLNNINEFHKNTKNKIKKAMRKGLTFEIASKEDIDKINPLEDNNYYLKDFYTVFERNNAVDYFLVSVDYNTFLDNSEIAYNKELEKNNTLNEKLTHFYSEKLINTKMNSDKVLLAYKNDIMEATKGISDNKKIYLAAALVVKHQDTVTVIYSYFDKNYKRFAANYFLYYNLIKYYQNTYKYLDLNGVVGDFKNDNPYHGLNRFKLGFNPNIYEFIGEFDLIIEPKSYDILLKNGILAKEFNKENK